MKNNLEIFSELPDLNYIINADFPVNLSLYLNRMRMSNVKKYISIFIAEDARHADRLIYVLNECHQEVQPILYKISEAYTNSGKDVDRMPSRKCYDVTLGPKQLGFWFRLRSGTQSEPEPNPSYNMKSHCITDPDVCTQKKLGLGIGLGCVYPKPKPNTQKYLYPNPKNFWLQTYVLITNIYKSPNVNGGNRSTWPACVILPSVIIIYLVKYFHLL